MVAEATNTIMAVGAHHDDNELVAGTLSLYKARGWKIVSVVMTNGQFIRGVSSPDHVPVREAESLAAAELLGMHCSFLRVPEGKLECTESQRKLVIEQIRAHRPRLLITHPSRDYHIDHEMTSQLVEQAVAQCWNPCVETSSPPCDAPFLYHYDAWFVPFQPDEYVDVTAAMDLKIRMLSCHRSQLPVSGSEEGDMIDLARLQSRYRGVEAGVRYAEAFRFVPRLGKVRRTGLLCNIAADI